MELWKVFTPTLQCQTTDCLAPILAQKQLAIAWKMATSDSCWSVANHFRIGNSTVGVVAVQVCQTVSTVIYPQVGAIIQVPEIIAGFQWMGFLNCAGAINNTLIPILCPPKLWTEKLLFTCSPRLDGPQGSVHEHQHWTQRKGSWHQGAQEIRIVLEWGRRY